MPKGQYPRKRRTLAERFWAKVERGAPEECWLWMGSQTSQGYGQIAVPGGGMPPLRAHRVAYELVVGLIPVGLVPDHLCCNKLCVNPDHLELVTHRENSLRGVGLPAVNARKTHCKRGHPLSGSNLYLHPSGARQCNECRRLRARGELQRSAA